MKYQALIIDDEPLARDVINIWLAPHPEIALIGECANGKCAVDCIVSLKPHVVFLDVQMPDMNGFEVIHAIANAHAPEIIFVTAYDEYALKAFEVSAVDYLLKPFTQDRFDRALARAIQQIEEKTTYQRTRRLLELTADRVQSSRPLSDYSSNTITIKMRGKIAIVPLDSIAWVEADGDYIRIHARMKTYHAQETLQNFERRLGTARFARIHRSVIVNLNQIKELYPHLNGEYFIILQDGTKLKMSRSYKNRLDDFLSRTPH